MQLAHWVFVSCRSSVSRVLLAVFWKLSRCVLWLYNRALLLSQSCALTCLTRDDSLESDVLREVRVMMSSGIFSPKVKSVCRRCAVCPLSSVRHDQPCGTCTVVCECGSTIGLGSHRGRTWTKLLCGCDKHRHKPLTFVILNASQRGGACAKELGGTRKVQWLNF